jgi:hypothetical protein
MLSETKTQVVERAKSRRKSPNRPLLEPALPAKSSANPAPSEQLLTVVKAADLLACSPRHIWRLMRPERRELDHVKIGGMTRTTLASVLSLIRRNKT